MKITKMLVAVIISAISLIGCGTQTEKNADVLPNYLFAVDEYVEMQPEKIEKINMEEYLPAESSTLYYSHLIDGEPAYYNIQYIMPYPEANIVEYKTATQLTDFDSIINSGYYYYDENSDWLVNVSTSILGTESNKAYMIPIDKALSQEENVTIQTVPYLFTVNTPVGTYNDCVCVIEEDKTTNDIFSTAIYYAKGIGEVLNVCSINNEDFEVSSVLSNIEVKKSNNLSIPTFFDGQRFECFETASGKDEILTIYLFEDSETGEMFYKGAFDSGLEFWFRYYGNSVSYETDNPKEFIEYKIDCLDGSDAFLKLCGSEMELIAEEGEEYGNMYQYSGTYIGLPDMIEE